MNGAQVEPTDRPTAVVPQVAEVVAMRVKAILDTSRLREDVA